MKILELVLVGISLAMDTFAVSVCKGLSVGKVRARHYLTVGAWFGGFQALMLALGYLLGAAFERYIVSVDHWIAFVLLGLIGGNMIKEGVSGKEEKVDESFAPRSMVMLAIATSIDALAVGVTFALVSGLGIVLSAAVVGAITFVISAAGLKIGNIFGVKYRSGAEIVGGCILIILGLKILLEHLGILNL